MGTTVDLRSWVKQAFTPILDGNFPNSTRPLIDGSGLPIGVPDPTFGIDDTIPDRPETWTSEQDGYYFVNFGTGTDSGRTNGDPTAPRKTIPNTLPAGSYVEVEGDYDEGSQLNLVCNGTDATWVADTAGPVWLTGALTANPHMIKGNTIRFEGTHLFVDGLDCDTGARYRLGDRANNIGVDHGTIRNCDIEGESTDTSNDGALISISGSTSDPTSDIVIFNNNLHDTGDLSTQVDIDAGCVVVTFAASNVWILNNTALNGAGNGIQINHGGTPVECHNVYIGNNEVSNTMQSGVWVKHCTDSIISQNYIHDIIGNLPWSKGMCIGEQFEPIGMWVLYNRLENTQYGVRCLGIDVAGPEDIFVIGNVIQGCGMGASGSNAPNINGAHGSAGIAVTNNTLNLHVYNNILFNNYSGINIAGNAQTLVDVFNNIVVDVDRDNATPGWHTNVATPNVGVTTLNNNLYFQTGGTEVIKWGNNERTLAQLQSSDSQCTTNCNVSDPSFTDPPEGNFLPTVTTDTLDIGASLSAINTIFNNAFGTDLNLDYNEETRVQGGVIDIGAYETG